MYKLQRLNVEKIATDENTRDKLLAQGFKLVCDKKNDKKEKANEGKK